MSGAIEKFNAALGYALDPAGDYLPAQARLMVFVAQLRGRGDLAAELAQEFNINEQAENCPQISPISADESPNGPGTLPVRIPYSL